MSSQRIRILSEITINQIAAGEVIENPASVIKELIENALDAKASQIHLETMAAGRGLIRVVDDGVGMDADDLLLSVERHATSKLVDVEGLNVLNTFGFRGEALPSIASISKMSLHSATQSGEGALLNLEGGKILKLAPLPRSQGTTVEVRSLFFNVPVRKKFQKSVGSDISEIHKLVSKFAISYPSLSISWINDGKQQISLAAVDSSDVRMQLLLGEEFVANAFSVEHAMESLSIRGKICQPHLHRPNKTGQFVFLNGRAVTSPFVNQKILEAYATRLPPNRYPLFIVQLQIPPSWIDVNVHPQKKEVRIREEEKLSGFLNQAIEKALEQKTQASLPPLVAFPVLSDFPKLTLAECDHLALTEHYALDLSSYEQSSFLSPQVAILGKIKNYFLVQEAEGIRLVDAARALERIIFEELSEENSKPAIQSLLLPLQITLADKETVTSEKIQHLNEKGIGIRHFGGDTYVVDSLPAVLEIHEVEEVIQGFLFEGSFTSRLKECLKKRNLSIQSAAALIEKLYKCKNPDITPHGKKIHFLLDEHSLAKLFG